ncbi:MAG: hypothetical protein DYH06_15295 [Acidobacteria bacterium ACB2]|nr:hypothetical protein [Acidobacteria bacterium ACB2]
MTTRDGPGPIHSRSRSALATNSLAVVNSRWRLALTIPSRPAVSAAKRSSEASGAERFVRTETV